MLPTRSITIAPQGELCEDTLGPFEADLAAAHGDVVVDLAGVTVFSAAAVRAVIQARKRGTNVRLVNPAPLTARVLEVCGLLAG